MNNTESNNYELHCSECVAFMKTMKSDLVDLVITSPPYDAMRDYKGYVFNFELIANELFRIIKPGGVIVWVVADQTIDCDETGTSFRQALYFKEIGFKLFDTMIYAKKPKPTGGNRYWQVFEYMFILSKITKPKTINLLKDRPNRDNRGKQKLAYRLPNGEFKPYEYKGHGDFGKRTNIWEYDVGYGSIAKNKIAHQHPAIFPEKLAEDHILSWSQEYDLVFDPMCGSCTTGAMAKKHKRSFIGVDISKEYIDIAYKRLNSQEYLF